MIRVCIGQIKDQNLIRSIITVIACQDIPVLICLLSLHLSGQKPDDCYIFFTHIKDFLS